MSLLKQARLDGLLAVNVAEDVDPNLKPKQPKLSKKTKDERHVTSREADELAEKILSEEPDGLRVAVWLARTTGMRRGEILGLTWADVDFEGETIYVRRALGRKGIKGTKTYDSMRDIPVAKPVWQYLLKWRDRQQELFKADRSGMRLRGNRPCSAPSPVEFGSSCRRSCKNLALSWMILLSSSRGRRLRPNVDLTIDEYRVFGLCCRGSSTCGAAQRRGLGYDTPEVKAGCSLVARRAFRPTMRHPRGEDRVLIRCKTGARKGELPDWHCHFVSEQCVPSKMETVRKAGI